MFIEPEWLHMLVARGEKVTLLKLTKYDFIPGQLILLFLLTGCKHG
jgi:hypothetical protein